MKTTLAGLVVVLATAGCADGSEAVRASSDDVTINLIGPNVPQYESNVAFARGYTARCTASGDGARRRVLVSGFHRFQQARLNASGLIVSALVPAAEYRQLPAPAHGAIEKASDETRAAVGQVTLASGEVVDVCGVIVPVFWDVAAVVLARELAAFRPDFVVMNGVHAFTRDIPPNAPPASVAAYESIWLEQIASNRAENAGDGWGSGGLAPVPTLDAGEGRIIADAELADPGHPRAFDALPTLASWDALKAAAAAEISAHRSTFGNVLSFAKFSGGPRAGNTFLCNDLAFITSYLMQESAPGAPLPTFHLLTGQGTFHVPPGTDVSGVEMHGLPVDLRHVPRLFIHWPASIQDDQSATAPLDVAKISAAASVLEAIVGAQLAALPTATLGEATRGEPPLVANE